MTKRDRYVFAAVASVAALAIGAFLVIQRPRATQMLMADSVEALHRVEGRTPEIANSVAILRTSGSAVDAVIDLPPMGKAIELRVLPEFTARPDRYCVSLYRMSADERLLAVATLGGLTPAPDNFVTVFVDGGRLQPGRYRLTIAGDPDTDARYKESAFILRMRRDADSH